MLFYKNITVISVLINYKLLLGGYSVNYIANDITMLFTVLNYVNDLLITNFNYSLYHIVKAKFIKVRGLCSLFHLQSLSGKYTEVFKFIKVSVFWILFWIFCRPPTPSLATIICKNLIEYGWKNQINWMSWSVIATNKVEISIIKEEEGKKQMVENSLIFNDHNIKIKEV